MMMTTTSMMYGLVVVLLAVASSSIHAIYIAQKKSSESQKSENEIIRTKDIPPTHFTLFHSDMDIKRYLNSIGRQVMLWRCKNAIKISLTKKVLSHFDLYCEVMGTINYIRWHHGSREINITSDNRYNQIITPHFHNGRYYSAWIDFRLRVYSATKYDSGLYYFTAVSPYGDYDEQTIYVDISRTRQYRKWRLRSRKRRKRKLRNKS